MSRPKILYKYRSIAPSLRESYVRSLLAHQSPKIYLSTPSEFNDPFECQPEVLVDSGDPLVAGKSRLEVLDTVRANLRDQMLVYSMSAINNHILMWSHYANSHRGICLGFAADGRDDIFAFAEPIVYQEALLVFDLRSDRDPIESAKNVALVKGTRWAYEQEWRIALVGRAPDRDREVAFEPATLTEVILGCEISKRDSLAVKVALAIRDSPVTLYQAHRNALKHAIEILPIGQISSESLNDDHVLDLNEVLNERPDEE